ncbi:hypothetical protein EMIT0P44_210038 [Pseudomonas sp. IT-P44]|uniref:hypothetical protein n=1 Tax=Pseudomonas sp. IT-P44 TaxID=3026451 RepID=UPI0039DF3956
MTSNLKIETIDSVVYLCFGAKDARSHRLTFVGQADSPWVGQSISLNALGTFPVSTIPAIGLYQPFPVDGGDWTISCPDDGETVSFAGQLQSEFTAAPYPISFELGHYLREFLGKRNPISAPMIGEEVTAEVQVVSAYTQKILKDIEVQWFVGDQPAGPKNTSDLGWSKFSHTFVTDGDQLITAKVFNPYNDTWAEHSFALKVYADSPWENAELKVNGVPVTWRSPVLLRRGQANEVTVKVEPAIAETLRLELFDEEGLDIDALPSSDVWQGPNPGTGEFEWIVTSNEEKSGRVRIVFYSLEVGQPWEHDCRVLSDNLADEAIILIGGVEIPPGGWAFVRGEAQTLTVVAKPGSPLGPFPVMLQWVTGSSGLKAKDFICEPAFDADTADYNWSIVGPADKSGIFQLKLLMIGLKAPTELPACPLLSPDLEDEVDLMITQSGEVASPVDLKGDGLSLTKQSARLTMTLALSSPLIGRTVAFKWKGDANPSVVLPAPFVMAASTVVEINGVDNSAWLKRHQLCLDYGGAVTESWTFRYFRGLPSSGLSIWCDGVNHGADSLLLKFNKNYELSIRPKTEDSVFVGWKCKFVGVVEQGTTIELLPPSDKFEEIGSPAAGGAKKTIRARDTGGGVGRKVDMDVQVKDFGVLKVPIEIV